MARDMGRSRDCGMQRDGPNPEQVDGTDAELAERSQGAAAAVTAEGSAGAVVSGRERPPVASGFIALGRWVSGWALLSWFCRLLLFALGWRREARIEISDGILSIRRTTAFRGRIIHESEEKRLLRTVLAASRQVRYPALHLAVGAFSLGVGVLAGGVFAWDALRFGDWTLLVIAFLFFVGAGLDLLLDILIPGRAGRVGLDIQVQGANGLRLVDVSLPDADRFLTELTRVLERPSGGGKGR